jgi:hypothetical protein
MHLNPKVMIKGKKISKTSLYGERSSEGKLGSQKPVA